MQGGGPMYWEPHTECMDREELEQLQFERLQSTLNRIYSHVPFYRKRFDSMGSLPEDIASLGDFSRLPFTAKEDLRESYPYGLFAVPLREVVRIHASSGTTGASTVVGYTRNDIRIWSNLTARVLTMGGGTKDDVVQIAFGYGLFTGGFGLHYGAERIGASVIPASSGHTLRQIKIMTDFKTTALISTPSYAMLVAETIREQGIPLAALSLKYGLFGAEPWSERMRQEIQEKLGIVATDNYGLSEIIGPGVSGECREQNGLHINEDHFLVEGGGGEGGARDHLAHQGGLSHDPVPDAGSHQHPSRALPLRANAAPDGPSEGADRRHADHQGGERLPLPDRIRPLRNRGDGAALPDRDRPEGGARRGHRPSLGGRDDLFRS